MPLSLSLCLPLPPLNHWKPPFQLFDFMSLTMLYFSFERDYKAFVLLGLAYFTIVIYLKFIRIVTYDRISFFPKTE